MSPSLLSALRPEIEAAEGRTSWLYRDSAVEGHSTVGVGHLVPSYLAARALPFAPPIESAEWEVLMAQPAKLVAAHYKPFTRGRLPDEEIDLLLERDLDVVHRGLQGVWSDFDAFPEPAQVALIDMAYNLGIGGLKKFSRLGASVIAKDWARCALQCHRRGIGEARNVRTSQRFAQAAAQVKT